MIFKLTQRGVAIPAGALTAAEFTRLRSRLTIKNMGFGDRLQTMQCYEVDKKARVLYAARIRAIVELARMGHMVESHLPEGRAIAHIKGAALALKPYQQAIVDHLVTKVYNPEAVPLGVSSAYLDLQPGKGKTYIIMALIRHFARKTLILVPGKELVVQTVATLQQTFPELSIGEYWTRRKIDGDIVVMTTCSAATATVYKFKTAEYTPAEYFSQFGFVAMDELHTYCTQEYQEIFRRAGARYVFGCSGTTAERDDKMDAVAYMHVGRPIMGERFMPIEDAEPWLFDAICLRYNGPEQFTQTLTSSLGTVSCAKMVSQFSRDPWRSQLLVDTIRATVAEGHHVFVMLDRTELCKLAWDYLKAAFTAEELAMTPGARAAALVTGRVKDEMRATARQSRVVVGTYACLGTGVSWDEFSAFVAWHPRRNKWRQFLNRIFREGGDRARTRVAYFLQDNATSIKSQYTGFRRCCIDERGVEPRVIRRDWTDIQVTPEVQKIADDFARWDDDTGPAPEKNNITSSDDDVNVDDIDEGLE